MPILCFKRSSRLFKGTSCPTDCVIPTGDGEAYDLNPEFRWVYNKLLIAESQDIACGPHGTNPAPHLFPIFSKPIYNLGGMGADARVIETLQDYWQSITAGHMWSEFLQGEHYSTDVAVVNGQPLWFSHTRGIPGPQQMWDYWEVNVPASPSLQQAITTFIKTHLTTYTGMLNIETIGGRAIEVHLRLFPQWPDLYGNQFLESLVTLYHEGCWPDVSPSLLTGYSVVLFDDEKYARLSITIPDSFLEDMEQCFGVSSITMRYDSSIPFESVSRPLGGFRIA